jgi:molybdenum cofactor synthesis domain-containing protein
MFTAAVITVSDKGAAGEREDLSGPIISDMLKEAAIEVVRTIIIPDEREQIEQELIKCADDLDIALVVTTGGTGFAPRDVTPEATIAVCTRMTPGISEAMRAESLKITNRAVLTRQQAGIRGGTLIINLPGSPKAAKENLAAVLPAIEHGLEMLRGAKRDCAAPDEKHI